MKSNAGSRNEDGRGGPEPAEHRPGHQIGVGLADPRPGVAQGDTAAQHGVQHPMAQSNLLRALRHGLGGKKVFENVIDIVMGILPVIDIHIRKLPLIVILGFFSLLIVFAARPPDEV